MSLSTLAQHAEGLLFIGTYFYAGAAIVTAIGATVAAVGTVQNGKAQQALANYNADQEKINAEAASRDANIRANQIRARNKQIEAKQRAAFGASGVAIETGSPLITEMETHANLEMAALNAEREGGIEASKLLQQGELDKIEGANARRGSLYAAGGTLLTGYGSAAGSYGRSKSGG